MWESEGIAPQVLTLALDGGDSSASQPGRFTSAEKASGTHWIGGWVGPKAGLDAVEQRKIYCPCRESNPGRPARSPSLYRLSHPNYPTLTSETEMIGGGRKLNNEEFHIFTIHNLQIL
jgi:hypothetical protein